MTLKSSFKKYTAYAISLMWPTIDNPLYEYRNSIKLFSDSLFNKNKQRSLVKLKKASNIKDRKKQKIRA